jgi:hypothetical protein
MAIILKANKVNLFESSVLFVFWYHLPNVLDTPRIFHAFLTLALDESALSARAAVVVYQYLWNMRLAEPPDLVWTVWGRGTSLTNPGEKTTTLCYFSPLLIHFTDRDI